LALGFPQVIQNLLLAVGKVRLHLTEQCSLEQTQFCRSAQANFPGASGDIPLAIRENCV
jgi:hypothetical protein